MLFIVIGVSQGLGNGRYVWESPHKDKKNVCVRKRRCAWDFTCPAVVSHLPLSPSTHFMSQQRWHIQGTAFQPVHTVGKWHETRWPREARPKDDAQSLFFYFFTPPTHRSAAAARGRDRTLANRSRLKRSDPQT